MCWLSWISLQRKGHKAWQSKPVSEKVIYFTQNTSDGKLQWTAERTKMVHEVKPPIIVLSHNELQFLFVCLSKFHPGLDRLVHQNQPKGTPTEKFSWRPPRRTLSETPVLGMLDTDRPFTFKQLHNWLYGMDSSIDLRSSIGRNLMKGHSGGGHVSGQFKPPAWHRSQLQA